MKTIFILALTFMTSGCVLTDPSETIKHWQDERREAAALEPLQGDWVLEKVGHMDDDKVEWWTPPFPEYFSNWSIKGKLLMRLNQSCDPFEEIFVDRGKLLLEGGYSEYTIVRHYQYARYQFEHSYLKVAMGSGRDYPADFEVSKDVQLWYFKREALRTK